MGGWIDGCIGGWINGRVDQWMDGVLYVLILKGYSMK